MSSSRGQQHRVMWMVVNQVMQVDVAVRVNTLTGARLGNISLWNLATVTDNILQLYVQYLLTSG